MILLSSAQQAVVSIYKISVARNNIKLFPFIKLQKAL